MTSYRIVSSVCIAFLIVIAGCGQNKSDEVDRPVATINSTEISVDDFEKSYIGFLIGSGSNDSRRNRYKHLQSMIDNVLLSELAESLGLESDSLYKSFRSREVKKALGGRFYETALLEKMDQPTEEEIRRAFALSKDKVIVRHLFYLTEQEATEAYGRILAGTPFIDEAQRCYQTTSFDSTAGYLGPISYFSVDDSFAEAAFAMNVGEISAPVRSRVGYHIIKVDDRIRNQLITESEFQTRKGGVTNQFKLRKRRLEGDTFVRDYMEGLDVTVDAEGIAALNLAIKAIENQVGDQPVQVAENYEAMPFDLGALRESFNPSTVLATYKHLGEDRVFTAQDYYFWLRDLPFQEAASRTAASVGRALRNDAFADAGLARDLDKDEKVAHDVELASRSYLASAARIWYANQPHSEPSDSLVLAAFEAVGLSKEKVWNGSFWVVPFATYAEASRANESITLGDRVPSSFSGYKRYDSVEFSSIEDWGLHAARISPGDQRVVATSDGRAGIVFVEIKTGVTPVFEDYREQLRQSLRPHVNEYNALTGHRRAADIKVDTTLFELIMDLDRK